MPKIEFFLKRSALNFRKRKIALSTQKIQIQVGVGKGMPASEAEKMEEKDSKANNEVSSRNEVKI